ncbi:MAG: cytochrome c3 family protein, partial [Mycobacterium sp.]
MKARPLGCLTFSALLFAVLAALAVGAAMIATGNSLFSPGGLSAVTRSDGGQPVSLGGVTSHAQLGSRCDACHTAIWSGELTGDRCLACHTNVAQQAATRTGLHGRLDATAATCRGCHTDHKGAAASATLVDPSLFPHDQTGFALTAHITPAVATDVGCRECHLASPRDYASTDCVGCHQRLDTAKMAAHTDTYGSACLNCHDGKDTYGHAFAHTSYALTGKHASAATCDGCHHGATTLTALRATSQDCATCHDKNDIHQGRLGSDCAGCHNSDGWTGATLDHTTQTSFALTGKHADVACESCHVNHQWAGVGTSCATCHQKDDPHQGSLGSDCAACHVTADWKDVTFDHSKTAFPLTEAHASVDCASCHKNGQFRGTPTNCAACHGAPTSHNSKFGPNCASCHTTRAWLPASFDHSVTTFPLTGAHPLVVCQKCHANPTVTFTGAPTTCAACHTKPSNHTAAMATNCGTCHSTRAWTPATFAHAQTRFPLTGAHTSVTCARCHTSPNTFGGLSRACASCHNKPSSHTGAMGTNCGTCHSTRAWTPATFAHAQTRFPLTGAHTSV